MPIVEDLYKQAVSLNSEYLINCTDGYVTRSGTKLTYSRYKGRFYKIISSLNLNPAHRPHDGRKHFVTQAKKYHVDEYAIKYIVGHVISDITEKVYTTREISWLKEEIRKIQ
jgi:integrase